MALPRCPSEQVSYLPELVSLIGTFLDPPDLFATVQVSRLWNTAMIPSLWYTIDDTDYQWHTILKVHDNSRVNNGKDRNWIKSIFTKYGTYIRVLNIHWRVILEAAHFSGSCINIQTLIFSNPFQNRTYLEEHGYRIGNRIVPQTEQDAAFYSDGNGGSGGANMYSRNLWSPFGYFTGIRQELEWKTINIFLRLIHQNPNISEVRLCASLKKLTIEDFLDSILNGLKSIRRLLTLDDFNDCKDLGALLEMYPSIQYYGSSSPLFLSCPLQKTLTSLQALRIQSSINTVLFVSIVRHLPNLHSLWIGGFLVTTPYCEDNFVHEVKNVIRSTSLRHLHIGRGTRLEDELLRAAVLCMPDLRSLTAQSLSESTISTLVDSCPRLESVTLSIDSEVGDQVPYNTLNYFVEHCRSLRSLDASRYSIQITLWEEKAWACQDLELLKCQILSDELIASEAKPLYRLMSVSDEEVDQPSIGEESVSTTSQLSRDLHHQIYSHLAELTKLKTLILWKVTDSWGQRSLDWTLENGLSQLLTLRDLEVVGFDGMTSQMGSAELKWISDSWLKLRLLYGLQPSTTPLAEHQPHKDALRTRFMALRPDVRLLTFLP